MGVLELPIHFPKVRLPFLSPVAPSRILLLMTFLFFPFSPALAKCLPAGNHVRSCQSTESKYLDERTTLPPRPALLCELLKPAPHLQHTSLKTPVEESARKPNSPARREKLCNWSKCQMASVLYCIGSVFASFKPIGCRVQMHNLSSGGISGRYQGWVRMQRKRPKHPSF